MRSWISAFANDHLAYQTQWKRAARQNSRALLFNFKNSRAFHFIFKNARALRLIFKIHKHSPLFSKINEHSTLFSEIHKHSALFSKHKKHPPYFQILTSIHKLQHISTHTHVPINTVSTTCVIHLNTQSRYNTTPRERHISTYSQDTKQHIKTHTYRTWDVDRYNKRAVATNCVIHLNKQSRYKTMHQETHIWHEVQAQCNYL